MLACCQSERSEGTNLAKSQTPTQKRERRSSITSVSSPHCIRHEFRAWMCTESRMTTASQVSGWTHPSLSTLSQSRMKKDMSMPGRASLLPVAHVLIFCCITRVRANRRVLAVVLVVLHTDIHRQFSVMSIQKTV